MPKTDLFASKLSHQLPQYFAWKLTTAGLGQSIPLWISPILPYFTRLEESELRPNRKSVACHTYLAVSNLVFPSTRNVYISSTATSK